MNGMTYNELYKYCIDFIEQVTGERTQRALKRFLKNHGIICDLPIVTKRQLRACYDIIQELTPMLEESRHVRQKYVSMLRANSKESIVSYLENCYALSEDLNDLW